MAGRRRQAVSAIVLGFFLSVLLLTHLTSQPYTSDRLPKWQSPFRETNIPSVLPLPLEYSQCESEGECPSGICTDLFSANYIRQLVNNSQSYCEDGAPSDITCFHTKIDSKSARIDSFCIARGAHFDVSSTKYILTCPRRDDRKEDRAGLKIPLERMHRYWYMTGPIYIFTQFIQLEAKAPLAPSDLPASSRGSLSTYISSSPPPRFQLLVKREGCANLWHSLMEIWSTSMTFDALRLAPDPKNPEQPLFRHPFDSQDTQVVILDDHPDGPYFDLWKMFAQREPVRLKDLLVGQQFGVRALEAEMAPNIIIPLAGGSNPLWQNDWVDRPDCIYSPTLQVFARRVLEFYNIVGPEAEIIAQKDIINPAITLTFIDRRQTRRLVNQTALLMALGAAVPEFIQLNIQAVDFAEYPFDEQLRIAHATDVLVGVHGAGLTHAIFMKGDTNDWTGGGVVVELQPEALRSQWDGGTHEGPGHVGFKNLARMLALGYRRIAVREVVPADGDDEQKKNYSWQTNDVAVDEEEFVGVLSGVVQQVWEKRQRASLSGQ